MTHSGIHTHTHLPGRAGKNLFVTSPDVDLLSTWVLYIGCKFNSTTQDKIHTTNISTKGPDRLE